MVPVRVLRRGGGGEGDTCMGTRSHWIGPERHLLLHGAPDGVVVVVAEVNPVKQEVPGPSFGKPRGRGSRDHTLTGAASTDGTTIPSPIAARKSSCRAPCPPYPRVVLRPERRSGRTPTTALWASDNPRKVARSATDIWILGTAEITITTASGAPNILRRLINHLRFSATAADEDRGSG